MKNQMSLFSLFACPNLSEFLQRYAPELLQSLKNLQGISPQIAEFLEKGWGDDLEIFYSQTIMPLYDKLKGLSPWRLHQENQLLEEVEIDLQNNLTLLIEIWSKEVKQKLESAK